jgi:tetratricopeptide (TPR) repeat protein
MTRKAITVCILMFLLMFCLNLTPSFGTDTSAEESAGYALLDSLLVTFKELAEQRNDVVERTNTALGEMAREAQKAESQGQIDAVFFKRFQRILMVIKCVITPIHRDEEAWFTKSLYFEALEKFVEDIEGEPFNIEKSGHNVVLNKFTQAVSHEIIDLRIYLDNKDKRERLIKEYQELLGISKESPELAEKERQLKTMRDISFVNAALSDYVTDYGIAPKQAGQYERESEFHKKLSPFYIKNLPFKDGWGNGFYVYTGKACNGIYDGIKGCTDKDIIVISFGRDGKKENWKYNPKDPEAGIYVVTSNKDFDNDFVIWNGKPIRAPRAKKK